MTADEFSGSCEYATHLLLGRYKYKQRIRSSGPATGLTLWPPEKLFSFSVSLLLSVKGEL